ncbi:hypothetical protein NliqN6_0018 [Naganishia liquefaciens]|uniref:beta-glucosidase n=1 Tax=Naganishia liquefaciens TaxID=104408 RepID=A0A8H3TMV5_9TREE|nr:hypothetical protein NliqN6_0018 [Naganishia liquefaciens]
MASSKILFQQLVGEIAAHRIDPSDAAKDLYSQLTPDERLWLLDGDIGLLQFIVQFIREGYCFRPAVAGSIPRLGIPGIRFSDGPRGVQLQGKGTAFPTTSTRAQTWNPDLEEQVGVAIGKELRALGGNYYAGVCVNLAPNPKWGRAQESYGEDPLLIGTLGSALVRGVRTHAIACVKHFALNSMENKRFEVDVECDPATMHECFLPHFRQCLVEGGAESLMSAYNSVNGEYAGDNAALLGILRETWGKEDVVVTSDWLWGTRDSAKSVKAGLDVEMPLRSNRAWQLPKLLRQEQVEWRDIERIGQRILRMELAYYARMVEAPQAPADAPGCKEHRDLAKHVAAEGMVLLKNDDVLPIRPTGQRILVVGPLATSTQTGDNGSSFVPDSTVVSPLEGLRSQSGITIAYLDGYDLGRVEREAQRADIVFALVGYTGADEGEYIANLDPIGMAASLPYLAPYPVIARAICWTAQSVLGLVRLVKGEIGGGDRKTLRLRRADEQLLRAIVTVAGTKTIVAIESSGPVILPALVRKGAAAIMMTGYGGCQYGNALREVLFGDAEPAGRLAYSIVKSEDDIAEIDMNATSVVYNRFWGYRLIQLKGERAAYPFGFGLGYGDFTLEDLQTSSSLNERFFEVRVCIANRGLHQSSTVVQVYAGKASPLASECTRVLVGFARSSRLPPGQFTSVSVRCRLDPLARWESKSDQFCVTRGWYKIAASRYEGDADAIVKVIPVQQVRWTVKTSDRFA